MRGRYRLLMSIGAVGLFVLWIYLTVLNPIFFLFPLAILAVIIIYYYVKDADRW